MCVSLFGDSSATPSFIFAYEVAQKDKNKQRQEPSWDQLRSSQAPAQSRQLGSKNSKMEGYCLAEPGVLQGQSSEGLPEGDRSQPS